MASWNNLPNEIKWLIIEHLIRECCCSYNYCNYRFNSRFLIFTNEKSNIFVER